MTQPTDPEGNEFGVERPRAERHEAGGPRDTGERDFPPVDAVGERALIEGMLEWYRRGVVLKVAGLDPTLARTSILRSGTTIAGLLKHLALNEDTWFTRRFAGSPDPEPWASAPFDDDRDWEFHSAVHDDLADLVALYEAACDRSRAAVVGRDLDDGATAPDGRPFNLRFALVHMMEETARHLGHLDVLREALDGTTGE